MNSPAPVFRFIFYNNNKYPTVNGQIYQNLKKYIINFTNVCVSFLNTKQTEITNCRYR